MIDEMSTESDGVKISAAASGWAGWVLAHPEFGSSVNPIATGGGQIMPTTLLLAHLYMHWILSWHVTVGEIECTVHFSPSKRPIKQFQPCSAKQTTDAKSLLY